MLQMAKFISSSCLICTYKPAAASRWQKACDNLQLKKFRNFLKIVPFNVHEAWHQHYRIITNAILKRHHSRLFALDTYCNATPNLDGEIQTRKPCISSWMYRCVPSVMKLSKNTTHFKTAYRTWLCSLTHKISKTALWHPCYTDTASEVEFSHK